MATAPKKPRLGNQNSNLESPHSKENVRADLLKVLTEIDSKKTLEFAVGAISSELPPIPGITITGYGKVSLPVTNTTVEDLKKNFQQAPYGLGEATLIDKNVRDSFQLDPKKFKITNKKFTAGVGKLVTKIKEDLGCTDVNVTSQLYKLLLYEPGGHFKPHRDTEKFPGMFATLIIQLPSVFSGGDLVVKHNSKEKRIKFSSKESEFSCFYAAHYSDCEHELTKIKSGYRMALVYSLCWDGNGVVPSPPDIPTNRLAGLLQHFDKAAPNGILAWGLDHQYSENSFLNKGVEALKGGDKLTYASLQGANALLDDDKKLDFLIVGAQRNDNMSGECEREWGRRGRKKNCFIRHDCDTDYEYDLIDVNGEQWSKNAFDLEVDEDVLNVGEDPDKFWGKCIEGECSGPSGNEGAYKTNWYRRYVLLIFPKGNDIKVAFSGRYTSHAVDYLEGVLKSKDATSKSVRKIANDIIDLFTDKKESFLCSYRGGQITMLKNLLKIKDLELIKKYLLLLSEPCSRNEGAAGIPEDTMVPILKELIDLFGWKDLAEDLTKLIESCQLKQLNNVAKFMEQCPKDVPTDQLMTSLIQKGVKSLSDTGESKVSTDNVKALGSFIVSHPKTCSQFKEAYFNSPQLQSVQVLCQLMKPPSWYSNEDNNTELRQMVIEKFCEKLHRIAQEGQEMSSQDSSTIAEGVRHLHSLKQEHLLTRIVEDVIQIRSEDLLNSIASSYAFSADSSEPVKRLLKARIDQLLPIVQAGEPKTDWRRPTAVFPGHPQVETFMRGPDKTFHYKKFNARCQAERFERDNFRGKNIAVVSVNGSGHGTSVQITKLPAAADRNNYDTAMRKYTRAHEQFTSLKRRLGLP